MEAGAGAEADQPDFFQLFTDVTYELQQQTVVI